MPAGNPMGYYKAPKKNKKKKNSKTSYGSYMR